jgi:hypothetical protein
VAAVLKPAHPNGHTINPASPLILEKTMTTQSKTKNGKSIMPSLTVEP